MTEKSNTPLRLTLAHINDTHSYFEPTSLQLDLRLDGQRLQPYVSAGGFARIATRANQLRDEAARQQRGFLFLHAGDCFQGTLYFSLFKGKANADLLNALNIDAMALGNHELDMGNEPVAHFVERIQFPLLAGNWDLSGENTEKAYRLQAHPRIHSFQPESATAQWIQKVVDGEPLAIFGLSLDKMADISNPDPDTPFVDAVATARRTVAAIQAAGINKIILLSHLGYESDLALAEEVAGISLIVGGHSHRLQGDFSDLGLDKDDDYGVRVNETYIVQAGYHALSIGHCHIDFAADGRVIAFQGQNELLLGRRLFLDASMSQTGSDDAYHAARDYLHRHPQTAVCQKAPNVHALLQDKYIPRVRKLQQQVIATAEDRLRHVRIPDEKGASELAPLVAESFYFAMNQRGMQVQFAIHNAGGVRNSLDAGAVSVADIAGKLLPFAVPIGVYDVSGGDIAAALEGAINNATNNGVEGTGTGSYPYAYRLSYDYDASAPLGERIRNLSLYDEETGWQRVQKQQIYRGTSSAYTMKGKEGYDALLNMHGEGLVTSVSMADCFIELLDYDPQRLNRGVAAAQS